MKTARCLPNIRKNVLPATCVNSVVLILPLRLFFSKNKGGDTLKGIALISEMAEREGFEPSEQISPLTRLAGERLQPTRPPLRENKLSD